MWCVGSRALKLNVRLTSFLQYNDRQITGQITCYHPKMSLHPQGLWTTSVHRSSWMTAPQGSGWKRMFRFISLAQTGLKALRADRTNGGMSGAKRMDWSSCWMVPLRLAADSIMVTSLERWILTITRRGRPSRSGPRLRCTRSIEMDWTGSSSTLGMNPSKKRTRSLPSVDSLRFKILILSRLERPSKSVTLAVSSAFTFSIAVSFLTSSSKAETRASYSV